MKRRFFTLLEVMIAVFLLSLVGTVVGIRISRGLEEKQFQTAVNRLYIELESCRRLALNMQADWTAILEKKQKRIYFRRICPESGKSVAFEWSAPCEILWNHEPAGQISFLFSSSGKISPAGLLDIVGSGKTVHWTVPQMFNIAEGVGGDLPRPDEKKAQ